MHLQHYDPIPKVIKKTGQGKWVGKSDWDPGESQHQELNRILAEQRQEVVWSLNTFIPCLYESRGI